MLHILNIRYIILCFMLMLGLITKSQTLDEASENQMELDKIYTHPRHYLKSAYTYVNLAAPDEFLDFKTGEKLSESKSWKRYHQYDFSKILNSPLTDFRLGFIGSNYQRFRIHFSSIYQDKLIPELYHVTGKTKVKNNICSFKGTIRIKKLGAILNVKDYYEDVKHVGYLLAEYQFFEHKSEKNADMLHGVTYYGWYIKEGNKIKYDDLTNGGGGYRNAQAVGIWKSYNTKQIKRCNWGDSRIPLVNDMDIGVGEFCPIPKYAAYGWKDYMDAYLYSDHPDEKAQKREEEKWWKNSRIK